MEIDESLLRPELDFLDLEFQGTGEGCDTKLKVSTGHFHDCTRPPGHRGQHYSFSVESDYEIIWPLVSR
jgi:hypothetical protein